MTRLSTHVLDTALGAPAAGVAVALEHLDGGAWTRLALASTDDGGRIGDLAADLPAAGRYRLIFDTGEYFGRTGQPAFFPEVTVDFAVAGQEHYHVPLLLSPFGYSTYRGS